MSKYRDALFGLEKGCNIVIVYWMHLAQRDILQVHPGEIAPARCEVFSPPGAPSGQTRSPSDTVEITGIEGDVIDVIGLDAVDGTPLLDIKYVV